MKGMATEGKALEVKLFAGGKKTWIRLTMEKNCQYNDCPVSKQCSKAWFGFGVCTGRVTLLTALGAANVQKRW
jgi:hypothetical protein